MLVARGHSPTCTPLPHTYYTYVLSYSPYHLSESVSAVCIGGNGNSELRVVMDKFEGFAGGVAAEGVVHANVFVPLGGDDGLCTRGMR